MITRLSNEDIATIVEALNREIRRRAKIYGMDETDVLAAIEASNVVVENIDATGMDGLFIPPEESGRPCAVIRLNLDRRYPDRIQVLVHEYARYLMRTWVAEELFDAETVRTTYQDIPATRQRIATMVHRSW